MSRNCVITAVMVSSVPLFGTSVAELVMGVSNPLSNTSVSRVVNVPLFTFTPCTRKQKLQNPNPLQIRADFIHYSGRPEGNPHMSKVISLQNIAANITVLRN